MENYINHPHWLYLINDEVCLLTQEEAVYLKFQGNDVFNVSESLGMDPEYLKVKAN